MYLLTTWTRRNDINHSNVVVCAFSPRVILQPLCWCCLCVSSREIPLALAAQPARSLSFPSRPGLLLHHVCPFATHLVGVLHLHLSRRCSMLPATLNCCSLCADCCSSPLHLMLHRPWHWYCFFCVLRCSSVASFLTHLHICITGFL